MRARARRRRAPRRAGLARRCRGVAAIGAREARSACRTSSSQSTGAVAVDLATGETLSRATRRCSLLPASNEKLAVTYAALTALGPGFTIETDVLGEGEQVGTTWQGDLVLMGYGDPTLSSADLAVLAAQVRASGITRVTGRCSATSRASTRDAPPPGWKASFYINESPPLSALIVDRGLRRPLHLARPGARRGAALPRRARARRRAGRRRRGARHGDDAAVPLAAVDSPPLSRDRPVHGPRQRQLHGRDAPEAARRGAGRARHDRRRRGVVDGPARGGRRPARRRAARRRLRALAARPPDRRRRSRRSSRDVDRPRGAPRAARRAPRRGPQRDARTTACARGAATGVVRAKTGTTSNASALSGFVGRPLRLRGPAERLPRLVVLGARRAGPLRDGASRAQ